MAQYYYTSAALPMLSLEGQMPVTLEYFLSFCSETVGREDSLLLERLAEGSIDTPYKQTTAERWRAWELSLRNVLVQQRAAKLGWGADSEHLGERLYETDTLAAAVTAGNPLEVETGLDSIRWRFIDSLAEGHYFDIDFLVTYCLKLKILTRRSQFTLERGREAYERIYETTLESLKVGDTDGQ